MNIQISEIGIPAKKSLARNILIKMIIATTVVVIISAGLIYLYIMNTLEKETMESLEIYITERVKFESQRFEKGESGHKIFINIFKEEYKQLDVEILTNRFDELFQLEDDGTYRTVLGAYDGIKRPTGTNTRYLTGNVLDADNFTEEEKVKLMLLYEMADHYGPAWIDRFPNLGVITPANSHISYWPGSKFARIVDKDFDLRQRSWYKQALAQPNKTIYGDLVFDVNLGESAVSVATAVFDGSRHLFTIVNDILSESLVSRVLHDTLPGTYNFLISDDGFLILHPHRKAAIPQQGIEYKVSDYNVFKKGDAELSEIMEQINRQDSDLAVLKDTVNDQFIAYSRLTGPGWYFVTISPRQLLRTSAMDAARFILLLGLFLIIMETTLVFLLVRGQVIQPLGRFVNAINEITNANFNLSGETSQQLPLNREDEVGELARSFNNMATQLHDYSTNLEEKVTSRTQELQESQDELREQKQIIETTLENIEQGIIMLDQDMNIEAYNDRYAEIMEIPLQVVSEASNYEELLRYSAEHTFNDLELHITAAKDAAKSKIENTQILTFPDGKIVEIYHKPLPDGGVVRTFSDITDRENARVELEKRVAELAEARRVTLKMMKEADSSRIKAEELRIEAEAATEAKTNFLAAMSHEIRTPMNGIIGMVDLLRQSNINQEHSQMLQTISDSGQSLLTIINDILDFSKIEAGKLDLEKIEFSIMEVLESSAETLKTNALNKGLDLVTYVDPRIPQFVIGDPVRVRQILINMGGNAIKFTDTGYVTIRADLQDSDNADESTIRFRIIDQGIGISKEGQGKLFKAFSQAETSTTRKYGGTGLGLSICQRLTEMMKGDIGVESEQGKGSEFYFTVTFRKSDKEIHIDKVSDLSGLNIMLVSQNEMERFVCRQYLEHWHANTITIDDISDCMNNAESYIKEGKHLDIIVLCSDWSQEQQIAMREVFKQEDKLKDIKFVLLMKGRRTKPRLDNPETVQFDVGPMRRVTFLTAVSIAAGRASPEVFHEEQVKDLKVGNVALSVDDAIKQNALILVAEDNPTNRDVISRQLNILGYTCELANDGKEALEAWQSGKYFILLTDCHMPEMDGYELTGTIREDEKAQSSERAPIVAITANALRGEADNCLAAGMDDYMSKPIDMRELRDKLVRWMPHFNPKEDSLKDFTPTKPAENVTSKENNNSDAIDSSALMDMFGDDQDMFKEILNDFIDPSQKIIEEIKAGCEQRSVEAVKQAAHKLKSSARSVGANALADLCYELETAGKEDDQDTIDRQISDLDPIMKNIVEYITRL